MVWWELLLPRIGLRFLTQRTRARRMKSAARRFRELAARMGGVLIKVGQFLSARLDVLPREITAELAGLQDEVGAEKFDDIMSVVQTEFGVPLHEKFAQFDQLPMASASIGQVHRASLLTAEGSASRYVVVKVQRPHIQSIVESDLRALRVVGGWLSRFAFIRKRANVPALIEEFSRSMYEEMDYLHEGKNAETFAENFRDRPDIVVPRVVWSHTTRRVLTLQDVGAIKITDYAAIEAAGISRRDVAVKLVDTYLKQIFEDGFFHADPHPGNLFVLPVDSSSWKLVFVDFGMVGSLTPRVFKGLRDGLVAIAGRDAARLVRVYGSLDFLLPGTDVELLERATRSVFDKLWGRSVRDMMDLDEKQIREFIDEFGDLLYEMPFQIPENLILLGRCVGILAGIGTGLHPELNVWSLLAPYAQKLMRAEGGNGMRLLFREAWDSVKVIAALPKRIDSLVARLDQGKLDIRMPELRHHVARLEHGLRKLGGTVIFAAAMMCCVGLYLAGHWEAAAVFAAADVALMAWVVFGK